jgi:hypothetical protein
MAVCRCGIITGVLTWKEIRSLGFPGDKRGWHYTEGALYVYMASPFTIYSKNKSYRKIIEISPIVKRYLFKIRDISRDICLKQKIEISPFLSDISRN